MIDSEKKLKREKNDKKIKRAIALAGGGPAAGLHIGVLDCLKKNGIEFDVWALSCIGAWVGLVYNQCDEGKEVEQTYDFFKNGVFREDVSYSRFPINTVFGPDWFGNTRALMQYLSDPDTHFKNLWLPDQIAESFRQTMSFLSDHRKWTEGDFNQWMLNHVMAPNPFVRFLTSMMYLSNVTGLSRIYYPDSALLKSIKFEKLKERPQFIFHNAYNLTTDELDLFCNRDTQDWKGKGYKTISAATLCACSALPFIEGTVDIGGDTYCEGALVDTVNFKDLLKDHDLDEIWISRIVDAHQIRAPENLTNALANLCQLFAATVGEDDVNLFKYHVKEDNKWHGTIIEIQVDSKINYDWSHANLKLGRDRGYEAADNACKKYVDERLKPLEPALVPGPPGVRIITGDKNQR
jgi:predicted acylesterase/phospholipase RssA